MSRQLLVIGLTVLLLGCTKINQENFEQLEVGMSEQQIDNILGSADRCTKTLGTQTCIWGDEDARHIKVLYIGSKAVSFSYQES